MHPPPVASDAPLRIRVAQAEARRAGGLAELRELAASTDAHARELALRGLGRIGGVDARALLGTALADHEPRVVVAAITAIGVTAALDEPKDYRPGAQLVPLLDHASREVQLAAAEALGRAGDASTQGALVAKMGDASLASACALALGRHGRRKIALSPEARAALVHAASSPADEVRYAATYALSREHEPPADESALAVLTARVTDAKPEIRATAIAALGRRKAVSGSSRTPVEAALADGDWRVAVEAVRALAGIDETARTLIATSLASRPPHVVNEALRSLAGKSLAPAAQTALAAISKQPGWSGCLAAFALGGANVVDAIASCALPDHLKLPLLGEVVTQDTGDPAIHRAALRVLLAHDDARVRAAGLGALAATWHDTETRGQQALISTLTSALASKDPIIAGSAADAIGSLYDNPLPDTYKRTLDTAIAARALSEQDVELSTALFAFIEKHAIAEGLEACRRGLEGHPVRALAAASCLRALGDGTPTPAAVSLPAPPVDVATVIGHRVTWHLATARGPIDIELRPDVAPWAVASIAALTQRHFYDGLELHRVVPNFVAQGGDPTMSGWGGPGYTLPAEPSGAADGAGFVAGGLGIADAGRDSGGSQWFIMHSRAAHLDGRYTWAGAVTQGQAAADTLVIGDKVERATITIE